jgi:ketosteroid isomerase-like protein
MKSRQRTRRKDVDAIRAADAAWLRAYIARDVENALSFCDERGSMLMPHQPIVTGKAAIRKLLAVHLAPQSPEVTWHPDEADVARSGDFGYTRGSYKMSFKNAAGKTVSDKGKYLIVWKRHADGSWKVLFDVSNSDWPPI